MFVDKNRVTIIKSLLIKEVIRIDIRNILINGETGEILNEEVVSMNTRMTDRNKRLCKQIVDEMLERASKGEELDKDMLYTWCKITKNINPYGQVKIMGAYRDEDFERHISKDLIMTGYVLRTILTAHPFSGFLQKNRQTFVETWKDLYELLGIGNSRSTQMKVKSFLTKNKIIREFKIGGDDGKLVKRLILNPFLVRKSPYTAQVSAMVFQDYIKEDVNMSCYPLRWLQAMGYVKR